MRKLKKIMRLWLPLMLVTTILCLLVFVAVQQSLRQNANDPQIQMAQEAAEALNRGASFDSLTGSAKINIATSLRPFIIIFPDTGNRPVSSGLLHNKIPVPPAGVFEYVRHHGENRITWQPEKGIRIAAVMLNFKGNYSGIVLAGRSLREVEKRIRKIEIYTAAAWIVTLLVSLFIISFSDYYLDELKAH